mgnify:CR=1 FL=1
MSNKAIKRLSIKDRIILEELMDNEMGEIAPISQPENFEDEFENYRSQSMLQSITFVELAIINSYLHKAYLSNKEDQIKVLSYGTVDSIGRISFSGEFDMTNSFWFVCKFPEDDNEYIIQTKIFVDRNELITQLNVTMKKGLMLSDIEKLIKNILSICFNNSVYKGKCIKIKMYDSRFKGIEIIDVEDSRNDLILSDVQKKYIEHFISRLKKGGNARYLLNGEPGTGKTETIREIARNLMPEVTFIIPDFGTADDLTSILEACEIFKNGVIIMDDIDLYLGSRDNGSYTRLLGQFLSFFDGVKKRKISLLASTNDKGLVDKAAERPGRFNFTIDYTFLNDEQIVEVCKIHLPEKWHQTEVYEALTGNVNGKKVNITGAFIANLADNIKEMSDDDDKWSIEDTVSLIRECYKGFYSSQVEKEKKKISLLD